MMKWIKVLFKPFIWIYNNIDPIDDESPCFNPSKKTIPESIQQRVFL